MLYLASRTVKIRRQTAKSALRMLSKRTRKQWLQLLRILPSLTLIVSCTNSKPNTASETDLEAVERLKKTITCLPGFVPVVSVPHIMCVTPEFAKTAEDE